VAIVLSVTKAFVTGNALHFDNWSGIKQFVSPMQLVTDDGLRVSNVGYHYYVTTRLIALDYFIVWI
jgi:hypothetical protein